MRIDEFLRSRGFALLTGALGEAQGQQFGQRLEQLPELKRIAEIGFNAGHSAECFFKNCPQLEQLISFDINAFPYTKPAADFFQTLHPAQFFLVEGDSRVKVPEFASLFPEQKFDLIYIDGSHWFQDVVADILHAQELAHPKTLLWLDDYHHTGVCQAIEFCKNLGVIAVKEIFPSEDKNGKKRVWVEAEYI